MVDTAVHQFGFRLECILIVSYEIMIKLLFCVDDLVMLKSIFSELTVGFDRLLRSSRVIASALFYI